MIFQSTPSARRATVPVAEVEGALGISIHALREESDNSYKDSSIHSYLFQFTPSARRATAALLQNVDGIMISIHALREEGDGGCLLFVPGLRYFNPRPPRGERPPSASVTV